MPDITINGVVVTFPFTPYPVQEEYMSKVIECLQNSKHGVLESPTGTGKTLSLLCSSLSWLLVKKAQLQAQAIVGAIERPDLGGYFFDKLTNELDTAVGKSDVTTTNVGWGVPKIIYASRTHSQLSQAMQELKRTSYKHVKTAVLGSRDQLCIHSEVSKEQSSSNKIYACQAKVKARTCFYYNNVETRKEDPAFKQEILDIEDLVKAGQKLKCCPYFLSKELKQNADITFMPYNYLLDPKTRKSQGIDLQNNVVLLDEAHNVERMCEEAASLQISSTDVAICIDEITTVMKNLADCENQTDFSSDGFNNAQKDFTAEDLCILKTMFLGLEKAIDDIVIRKRDEGETLPGGYVLQLLEKAELTHANEQVVVEKLEKIILYLSTTSTSPFARRGHGLQKFSDLLRTVFSGGANSPRYRDRVAQCYKVHIQVEEPRRSTKNDGWEAKKTTATRTEGKLISYWCFSPGFGMQQLVEQGVRSIVLTSGTLSPLKSLISELGIPIDVQLENPHIVAGNQVCIGVLGQGPDGHPLNSSFNTRNDPKYIASLGRTVYNFSCLVPHGMLIFFPSYPIMKKCREDWQNDGLWSRIAQRKPIYVEPQSKDGFVNTMNEYYQKLHDPSCNGAIFMAVCRGKVSEGLDFADANGRAVLITGLPFPPLKDPRIVLKQKYLEETRSKDKEALTGQQWYQLEASRAVNQAIGRIIRHKNDYGAIILCDCRFSSPNFKKQLSAWLQPHVKTFTDFGMVTKALRDFFRYAEHNLPRPTSTRGKYSELPLPAAPARFDTATSKVLATSSKLNVTPKVEEKCNIEIYRGISPTEVKSKSVVNFNSGLRSNWDKCELTVASEVAEPVAKKRKIKVLPVELNMNLSGAASSLAAIQPPADATSTTGQGDDSRSSDKISSDDKKELGKAYLRDVKRSLTSENYKVFTKMIQNYTKNGDFDELVQTLGVLFPARENLRHLFKGFRSFLKRQHVSSFENYTIRLDSPVA